MMTNSFLYYFTRENFIELIAALVAVATIIVLWKYRKSPEVKYLIFVEVFAAVWATGNGIEYTVHTLHSKIIWTQFSYVGIVFLPVSYYLFTAAFSQKLNVLTPRNISLLLVVPFITLMLVFTNHLHHLVWVSIEFDPEINMVYYYHGVWFWFFWVYSILLIFMGVFNLVQSIYKFTAYYKSQVSTLLIATIIPLTGNLMYVTGLNPVPGFDWTPVMFIFTGLIITFGVIKYRIFDLVPFARNRLIETMDDGVLVVNSEGFIEDCNSAVHKIFQLQQKSIIREPFTKVFSNYKNFVTVFEKEGAGANDLEVNLYGTDKYYQVRVSPVFNRSDKISGHFIQIHDISSMKLGEVELKESNQKLRAEIEKRGKLIEDLDAFSHTVAHDLKNSLGSIFSSTEILDESVENDEPEQLKEIIGLVRNSAEKAMHITQELLILATVSHTEIELKLLNMKSIFREAQKRLHQDITASGANIKQPETWPQAMGHAPWIEAVWTNYLSNGIKYGGSPPEIEVGADIPENNHVRFWIKDNGKGLTKEEQSKLFRKYARLDPGKADGYGLGLSIVKRIVGKLGGKIGVESSGISGQGSLFYFILPRETD
ncbi:MAG: histidine kinase N-terminal 7TM domain-containing protein [Bacteroidota bacterium]